jgi:ion channel
LIRCDQRDVTADLCLAIAVQRMLAPYDGGWRMLRQILFGAGINICNIAIHAIAMVVILRSRRIVHARVPSHPMLRLIGIMTAVVSLLMAAHLLEITVWSVAYEFLGVAPENSDTLYFAFVNYTTLGYGDVLPVARWRLLGPMTAMNGVLLFGWSTAVIFQVLWTTISREGFRKSLEGDAQ